MSVTSQAREHVPLAVNLSKAYLGEPAAAAADRHDLSAALPMDRARSAAGAAGAAPLADRAPLRAAFKRRGQVKDIAQAIGFVVVFGLVHGIGIGAIGWVLLGAALLFLLARAGMAVHARGAWVTVTATRVARVTGLRRPRVVSRRRLDRWVLTPRRADWSSGQVGTLSLLAADGRRVLLLHGRYHRPSELGRLLDVLGLPVDVVSARMKPAQLARFYPRMSRWWHRHPELLGTITALAIMLVLAVVAAFTVHAG